MAKKKRKTTPFRREANITYNKYKPNRKARRLGIKPEEPPKKEESKVVSKAAVLAESIKRTKAIEKRIVPTGMTYREYMTYLKERQEKLEERKASVNTKQ